jgi:hypothetical protein
MDMDSTHGLLIQIGDAVFTTLIDTGADYSFMDADTAKALSIPIIYSTGDIQFASRSHSMSRLGVTSPITNRCLY